MALSKIDAELTATTTVPSEGGAATTNVVQGLAKIWCTWDMNETNVIKDSLTISSLTDDSTGINTLNFPPMGNAVYPVTACFHSDTTGSNANIIRVRDLPTTTTAKMHTSASQAGNGNSNLDMPLAYTVIHGDLA
jgi:hypothetical protein